MTRPALVVSLAIAVLLVTACSSKYVTVGSSPQPRAAMSTGDSAAAGQLLAVHDPGHVTYSITVTTCHALSGPEPDPACTPGSIDPSVTQADIQTTICKSGYTTGVRPPSSETNKAKKTLYVA